MDKCTRCGRMLKKSFIVEGAPYGPVCVRKLFPGYVITGETATKPQRKDAPIEDDGNQLSFFAPETTPEVVYVAHIVGDDADRWIAVHRPGQPVRRLPLNLNIVNHSPTGFCWGYGGSGPAQLAFSILYDFLGHDKDRTLGLYQQFKGRVIARFDMYQGFQLSGREIEIVMTELDVENMERA